MPITRTKADGSKTEISVKPVKIILAGIILYSAYELYKRLLKKEPRIFVIASEKDRSIVEYIVFNEQIGKWEIKTGLMPIEKHAGQIHEQLQKIGFKPGENVMGELESMIPLLTLLLNKYTYNDLRLLHNYWLKFIDRDESLFDQIKNYYNLGDAVNEQAATLKKLEAAGVGNINVLKIPKDSYLLK